MDEKIIIPDELWMKVFSFMSLKELQRAHLVNKQLCAVGNQISESWYKSHFSYLPENKSNISYVSKFFTTFRKEYYKNFSSERAPVMSSKWSLAEEDDEIFEVFYIAKTGDLERLKEFCDRLEADALDMLQFYRDIEDRTPLAWMWKNGHRHCLDYVFDYYSKDKWDNDNDMILSSAPRFGHPEGYRELNHAIPNIGRILGLAISCYQDHEVKLVKQELEKNHNQLMQGFNVLSFHLAVRYNNLQCLTGLLEEGVFPMGVDEWVVATWMFSLVWPRSQLEVFKCLYHHRSSFFNQFFNYNQKYHSKPVAVSGHLYTGGTSQPIFRSESELKIPASLLTTNFRKWAEIARRGEVVSFDKELSSFRAPLIFLAIYNGNPQLVKILLANKEIDILSAFQLPLINGGEGWFLHYSPLRFATDLGYKDIQFILELAVFIKENCRISEQEGFVQKGSRFLSAVFVAPPPVDIELDQAAKALFDVIIHGKSADTLMAHKIMLHQGRLGELYKNLIPQLPDGDVFSKAFVSTNYKSLCLEDMKPALQPARTSL